MHLTGKDPPVKTRFVGGHRGLEHAIAIERWAWNILRKNEQISGITQIKAYSREIETGDEYEFGIPVKALATGRARAQKSQEAEFD
jgi:hypothetical protein